MVLKSVIVTLLFVGSYLCSSGQSSLYSLILNNKTNKKIIVHETCYFSDTTKSQGYIFLWPKFQTSSSSDIYNQYIRLDIFALDSFSLDTVFSSTIDLTKFDSTKLVIDIVDGIKEHQPTIHPIERVKIHAYNSDMVFKLYDKMKIKTSGGFIVEGTIQSYDSNSLTIVNKKNKVTIPFNELEFIKLCIPRISITHSLSLFNKCAFYPINTTLTELVRQKLIKSPSGYLGWIWQ